MARTDTQIQGKIITSDEFYRKARNWANSVRAKAAANANTFAKGKKGTRTYKKQTKWHPEDESEPQLAKSVSFVIKEVGGITDGIKIRFSRHGIFRAYGVGSGQSIHGKQATKIYVKRTQSDWVDEPINKKIQDIANIAAEFYGDKAIINTYAMIAKK